MTQILTTVRGKVKTGHANLSFFLALAGGCFAAFSPLGGPVRAIIGIFWWLTILAFVLLFAICSGDWAEDAIPNRPAVYTAILWPICLRQCFVGKCGDKLFSAIEWLGKSWFGQMFGGFGQTPPKHPELGWQQRVHDALTVGAEAKTAFTVFSLAFITAGVVYAQRYAKARKKAGAPR